MEIELKLACNSNALALFEQKVLPLLNDGVSELDIKKSHAHLYNEYYDTHDRYFSRHQMGCRVRAKNQKFEQTIKTKGEVSGGLHQRPEYNVALDSAAPDLTEFPNEVWPPNTDVARLNNDLQSLFSTHFERTTFELQSADFQLELVFDFGEVKHEQQKTDISEIELELINGNADALFDIAELIAQYIPVRLSNVTKASRGYGLVNNAIPALKYLPTYLPLLPSDTTEHAFSKMLTIGLSHWQHHQFVFEQTGNLKALSEITASLHMLLQGVALYLPTLQCSELLSLHKQLLALNKAWAWQSQLQSIGQLRSKKGPFSRRIPKSQNIMNYLMGRREGLLNAYKPLELNLSPISTSTQLLASRVLQEKPWRGQSLGADVPVKKQANGWLSQSWQTIQQSLPSTTAMDDKQYLTVDVLLNQALINGFLLADLFVNSRGQFRAPWLDLATGIKELKALKFLHDALNDLELEDKSDFSNWIEDKTHSVIKVMEQTRKVAMEAETYWS